MRHGPKAGGRSPLYSGVHILAGRWPRTRQQLGVEKCVMSQDHGYVNVKILPDRAELERLVRSGMTHREIAEMVARQTGQPVRRSTVSAAIHRAGLSSPAKKYAEEIPWRLKERHQTHYAARMLRLLGRRRAGLSNASEMDQRLDSWLAQLADAHAVVTYLPTTEDGFFYVDGVPNERGIPVIEKVEGL